MGISMYNTECIKDPTPCLAFANIENREKQELAEEAPSFGVHMLAFCGRCPSECKSGKNLLSLCGK